jgi:hypothetical protein
MGGVDGASGGRRSTTGRAKARALREHARETARTRHELVVHTSGPSASRAQSRALKARWAELEATPGPSRREQGTPGRAGKSAGASEHGRARTRPGEDMAGRGRARGGWPSRGATGAAEPEHGVTPGFEGKPNANHVRARISNSRTQRLHK